MRMPSTKVWPATAVILALIFVSLAVIGGIQNHSPVPFWDMWNGYLDFYVRVSDGDASMWWAQHNEHRILFSRLLFWLDLEFFDGSIAFLIMANFALICLAFFIFFVILKSLVAGEEYQALRIVVAAVLCSLTFAWIQENNLTWGFQSQFIAAYLFPLAAFFFLCSSRNGDKNNSAFFLLATLAGIASVGTMANGILTLPLMVIVALLMRLAWPRTLALIVLTALELYLYFSDYNAPAGHGSLTNALRFHTFELAEYVLLYLGGPFYYMTGKVTHFFAQVAGLFLIGSTIFFTYKILKAPRQHALQLALVTFIIYVGGTAFATAGGRVIFGVEQALSSRYMTPSLMAWSALLLLFVWHFRQRIIISHLWTGSLLLIPLLLLPTQLEALKSNQSELFERMIAALALEIGVRDDAQLGRLFPSSEVLFRIAQRPIERNLSVFGNVQIRDARNRIGQVEPKQPAAPCLGSVDELSVVDTDPKYLRVRGWLYEPETRRVPEILRILDETGATVGFAITGKKRPDVAAVISKHARYAGFKGYVLAEQEGHPMTVVGQMPNCRLPEMNVKLVPYWVVSRFAEPIDQSTGDFLTERQLSEHTWASQATYEQDTVSGFSVFGSHITGDGDTGFLRIRATKGVNIIYKTGPVTTKQIVRLRDMDGSLLFEGNLPKNREWSILTFSAKWIPSHFVLELSDEGSEWGEWSAVGLKMAETNK